MNAFAVVSDSGTAGGIQLLYQRGTSVPAVCIRTSTERPEALDKGCFVLAGISEGGVEQAVATAVAMNANGDNGIPVPTTLKTFPPRSSRSSRATPGWLIRWCGEKTEFFS